MPEQAIDVTQLPPIQRIILTSNGTLTKLLENLLGEQLQVVKLSETLQVEDMDAPYLNLLGEHNIIRRKICLQGQNSGINWLYAESVIVPERLEPLFREELLESQIPIGNLWSKYRVETFKELSPPFQESANELATQFSIQPQQHLLGRTYRVFSKQQPVMMLTEKFPSDYFIKFTH